MAAIAIIDLEASELLDKKALANTRGGLNNVGYESNNRPAAGIVGTPRFLRTAILGVFTESGTGLLKRKLEDVYLQTSEVSRNVRTENVLF